MPRRRRRYRPNIPYQLAVAALVLAVLVYISAGLLWTWLTPRRMGVPNDLTLNLVARCLDATLALWFFAVGASIGSFLNVVAYRLPLGKTLGGHSACPYCTTPIAATDNIPVFAWFRLRGRCRTCHLPISIQYPLIELAVGLVFLSVYFTEFGVAGSNLPGATVQPVGIGLVWMSVTPQLAVRVLVFLFTLSGLIAAALMAARRSKVPATLYGWLLAMTVVACLSKPETVIVPWNRGAGNPLATTNLIDALVTVTLGGLAGLCAAMLSLPGIHRVSSVVGWCGTLVCGGCLLGWQAVGLFMACILLTTLLGQTWLGAWWGSRSRRDRSSRIAWQIVITDPVVWAWLGCVLLRARWGWLDRWCLQAGPPWLTIPGWLLGGVGLAWLVGWRGSRWSAATAEPDADPMAEPDAEPMAEPDAEPKAEPDAEPKAEPVEGQLEPARPEFERPSIAGPEIGGPLGN